MFITSFGGVVLLLLLSPTQPRHFFVLRIFEAKAEIPKEIPGWTTSDYWLKEKAHGIWEKNPGDFLQLLPMVPINVDQIKEHLKKSWCPPPNGQPWIPCITFKLVSSYPIHSRIWKYTKLSRCFPKIPSKCFWWTQKMLTNQSPTRWSIFIPPPFFMVSRKIIILASCLLV